MLIVKINQVCIVYNVTYSFWVSPLNEMLTVDLNILPVLFVDSAITTE